MKVSSSWKLLTAAALVAISSVGAVASAVSVKTDGSWRVTELDYSATPSVVLANTALTRGDAGLPGLSAFTGLTSEAVLSYSVNKPIGAWASADVANDLHWIGKTGTGNTATSATANHTGYYLFQYDLVVPVGQTVSLLQFLDFKFASDNRVVNIYINDTKLTYNSQWFQSPELDADHTYGALTGEFGYSTLGANATAVTLSFIVENNNPYTTSGNPTGLLASGTINFDSFTPAVPLPASFVGGTVLLAGVAFKRRRDTIANS